MASLLHSVSATTLFLPFTYSISKSNASILLTHFCCRSFNSLYSRKYLRLLWSVQTTNLAPTRYCQNFVRVCMMVSISLSWMEYNYLAPESFRLSNAMGWRSCISTAPMPSSDASHSRMKGRVKFGSGRTGQELMASFSLSKVHCAFSFHWKDSFFVRSISGALSGENPFTNLL